MMTKEERIKEVALDLRQHLFCHGKCNWTDSVAWVPVIAQFLSQLPEYQEPKSPWVQCSERMPPLHEFVVVETDGLELLLTSFKGIANPRWVAWLPLPPYVAPESELVRRFIEKLKAAHYTTAGTPCVQWLREVEKEMKAKV